MHTSKAFLVSIFYSSSILVPTFDGLFLQNSSLAILFDCFPFFLIPATNLFCALQPSVLCITYDIFEVILLKDQVGRTNCRPLSGTGRIKKLKMVGKQMSSPGRCSKVRKHTHALQ